MQREYQALYERDGDWWIGWTEELPGAFGQGRTIEETRRSLREAIVLLLETPPALIERRC